MYSWDYARRGEGWPSNPFIDHEYRIFKRAIASNTVATWHPPPLFPRKKSIDKRWNKLIDDRFRRFVENWGEGRDFKNPFKVRRRVCFAKQRSLWCIYLLFYDILRWIRCRKKNVGKGGRVRSCCDGDKLSPVLVATSSVENAVFSQNAGNNATKAGVRTKGLGGRPKRIIPNLAESDTREHTYESMIRVFLLLSSKPSPRHRFLVSFSSYLLCPSYTV